MSASRALKLLRQAEEYVPSSPELISLKERLRLAPSTIETTPSGADIYLIDYADPQASDLKQWEHLGRSPLKTIPVPREDGYLRIRVVKEGFETEERAASGLGGGTVRIPLHTHEETPPGMVWIPAFQSAGFSLMMRFQLPAAQLPAAWLDKYEVSNRQFKEFVDAGGYQKREYWKQPFLKDGKELSWEQAMVRAGPYRERRAGAEGIDAGHLPAGHHPAHQAVIEARCLSHCCNVRDLAAVGVAISAVEQRIVRHCGRHVGFRIISLEQADAVGPGPWSELDAGLLLQTMRVNERIPRIASK